MNCEAWRPIPGFPCYEASDHGRIRSTILRVRTSTGFALRKGRILKPSKPCGRRIHYHVEVLGASRYVHDLVALAWIGPKPAGVLVMHIDDNPANNSPANLRYGSKSENELAKHREPAFAGIPDDMPFMRSPLEYLP